MKKLVIKKTVKAVVKKEVKKIKKIITSLMLSTLGKNINYKFEVLAKQVKAQFPKSKWDSTHFAWYKSHIKAGDYKGR